jgi:hypothetical protein
MSFFSLLRIKVLLLKIWTVTPFTVKRPPISDSLVLIVFEINENRIQVLVKLLCSAPLGGLTLLICWLWERLREFKY